MRLLHDPRLLHRLSLLSSIVRPMATESLFQSTALKLGSFSSQRHILHSQRLLFTGFFLKPCSNLRPFSLRTNVYSYTSHTNVPRPVHVESPEEDRSEMQFNILKQKLEDLGIETERCIPGRHNRLLCPNCGGGDSRERSLSLFITQDGGCALWTCFRAKCGWKGSTIAFAGSSSSCGRMQMTMKKKRELTESELMLEPLCAELLAYFDERMISKQTLQRNGVKQRIYNDQIVIAFTYRCRGALVSCKYRDINKKFWQEADTEKIFYGLDDIEGESDIIIVEGEMDKLAMEEAGFRNCVSVPDGAPAKVSSRELPPQDKDKRYRYLWNCKDYLKKASRIILATDGDPPGQALAEELARRLGKDAGRSGGQRQRDQLISKMQMRFSCI